MNEIVRDIFTWAWFSEPHGYNFNGYLVRHSEGNLCVDPVPPSDQSLAEIAGMGEARILLTNRNHSRAANLVRGRTGARTFIHPDDTGYARSLAGRIVKLAVVCLRCKGRHVPKWQLHRAQRLIGQLTIVEEHDKVLHRTTRVARVIGFERRAFALLPPLFDATLIWMSNDQMALTGFERDDASGSQVDYAQTWLCEEAPNRP